jgi:hypothetical protein
MNINNSKKCTLSTVMELKPNQHPTKHKMKPKPNRLRIGLFLLGLFQYYYHFQISMMKLNII